MPTPNSLPRPIPATPNLEFDRKQSKALLEAARRGELEPSQLGGLGVLSGIKTGAWLVFRMP